MTTPLEITAHQIGDIIDGPKPFLVFFKSEFCDYCKALEPFLAVLYSRYHRELGIYTLDVDYENSAARVFDDYIQGVPSVILFYKGQFVPLKDPEHPDLFLWYRPSYIEDFIKTFLRSANE